MFQTNRLLLRPLVLSDLVAYHSVFSKKEIGDWLGRKDGFSLDQTQAMLHRMIKSWKDHDYGPWAMIHLSDKKLIGHCGLKYNDRFKCAELLYAIDPDYQKLGLTYEAAQKAMQWGSIELQMNEIVAFTQPHNMASRKLMEKLGFLYEFDFEHAQLPHVFYRWNRENKREPEQTDSLK